MPRPVALESFHLALRRQEAAPPPAAAAVPPEPAVPAPEPTPEPEIDPEAARLERLRRIAAALEAIAADQAALSARWVSEAASAFGAAAERVLPQLARAGFAGVVAESVAALARDGRWPGLELSVAPDEMAEIEVALGTAGHGGVTLRADPALAPGEVRLGWTGGGAEIDVEAIAGAALEHLRRALTPSADQGV